MSMNPTAALPRQAPHASRRILTAALAVLLPLTSVAASSALAAIAPLPAGKSPVRSAPLVEHTQTFRALGVDGPLRLSGDRASASVPFGLRLDEVVRTGHVALNYTASPALLAELSHLKVYLNDQLIGTVPLNKESGGTLQHRQLDFDPRLVSDYNTLRIELIGHYTLQCEDATHSSLWVELANDSAIELSTQQVELVNDLALLPAPFFDARDNRPVRLPLVFGQLPSLPLLHAAGIAASWIGALADYRGASFPLAIGEVPAANAIALLLNGEHLAGIELKNVSMPTISLRSVGAHGEYKLLLIQGATAADVETAIDALVLGQVLLSGDTATVQKVALGSARGAYDAPRWVRTDRPVRLGEIAPGLADLQAHGYAPGAIRLNVRLPADLFTRFSHGVPMALKYRYTPPLDRDNSTLNISINDQYLQTFRLQPDGEIGRQERVVLPLIDGNGWNGAASLLIPAFQVGSNNQLQFQFGFETAKQGQCRSGLLDNMRAALDPDSTLDLSDFPHYTAMPDLAAFANSGFPFTKFADLASTTVVLPEPASAADLQAYFELMGWMGRWTGTVALRHELLALSALGGSLDRDLLLVGNALQQTERLHWQRTLPALLAAHQRSFRLADPLLARAMAFQGERARGAATDGFLAVGALGDLGALVSFQSPLHALRTVVAVTGTTDAGLSDTLGVLADGGMVRDVRGDVALVRGRSVSSFLVGEQYYVGTLHWWRVVWFHLAGHPVLMAFGSLLGSILIALGLYGALRRRAERRLATKA